MPPYRDGMPHSDRQRYAALIRLLRETRRDQSVTQEDLSARLGKHRVFVTKYESGERSLSLFEVIDICRALSLDVCAVIRALTDEAPPLAHSDESYLLGFCKGFLAAKGFEAVPAPKEKRPS